MKNENARIAADFIYNLVKNFTDKDDFLMAETFRFKLFVLKKAFTPLEIKDFINIWREKVFFEKSPEGILPDTNPTKLKIAKYMAIELGVTPRTIWAWTYQNKKYPLVYRRYLGMLNVFLEIIENKEMILIRRATFERIVEKKAQEYLQKETNLKKDILATEAFKA